jgi:hypothetical protein
MVYWRYPRHILFAKNLLLQRLKRSVDNMFHNLVIHIREKRQNRQTGGSWSPSAYGNSITCGQSSRLSCSTRARFVKHLRLNLGILHVVEHMLGAVLDRCVDGSHGQQHGSKRLEDTSFEGSNTDNRIILRRRREEMNMTALCKTPHLRLINYLHCQPCESCILHKQHPIRHTPS